MQMLTKRTSRCHSGDTGSRRGPGDAPSSDTGPDGRVRRKTTGELGVAVGRQAARSIGCCACSASGSARVDELGDIALGSSAALVRGEMRDLVLGWADAAGVVAAGARGLRYRRAHAVGPAIT